MSSVTLRIEASDMVRLGLQQAISQSPTHREADHSEAKARSRGGFVF